MERTEILEFVGLYEVDVTNESYYVFSLVLGREPTRLEDKMYVTWREIKILDEWLNIDAL